MTCEEYLLGYRRALDAVRETDIEIREEEARQQRLAAKYEGLMVQSSKDPNAKLDPLGELILKREKQVAEAEEKQKEILSFIRSVGGPSEEDKRCRQILRLYYGDDMEWRDVQRLVGALRNRRDGRRAPKQRKGYIAESTLFRIRHEALAKAEHAYRTLHKYTE